MGLDGLKIEKHPGPFSGPDVELARACAMAVIPFYGSDDAVTHQRIMNDGIWNDHIAVQAALAAIHYLTRRGQPPAIGRNQILTPAQLPGRDEHTLERLDDAEAQDYAGPAVTIAPYKRPADKRVKALLDDAARNRAAEGERAAPRALFSDPRLAPGYKPPKKR